MKKAFITGITGQDGSYLAAFLLKKGYEVHGLQRRSSSDNTYRLQHIYKKYNNKEQKVPLHLHYGDITDSNNISQLIGSIKPHEIYNLAAQSHVGISFTQPEHTTQVDALGTLNILQAIKLHQLQDHTKYYQASTSELYGGIKENMPITGYNETSLFHPRSPYGVAKLYAYRITINYRESYDMFCCNGILFNHESPLRGENFVSRKITQAVAAIHLGKSTKLSLGNLYAQRDRGHAKDYVTSMRSMLQQESPDDYVISTGKTYSVKEFAEIAFAHIDKEIIRKGTGKQEKGYDKKTGTCLIDIDPQYFRPSEVDRLVGDASKAKKVLKRQPTISFSEMIKEMIEYDIQQIKNNSNNIHYQG